MPTASEIFRWIAKLSAETEWTTEELHNALREAGIDPQRFARDSSLLHKLGCNEYHAHHAPECCASECWCQQPVLVSNGSMD